jgi:hypothetical protein
MLRTSGRVGIATWVLLLACCLGAPRATAGDLCVFMSTGSPNSEWGKGYGAALSSTWFDVVDFEGEAERLAGEPLGPWSELAMHSFTASVLLAPPVGRLRPYGGLGFGLFRQTLGSDSDTGRLRAFILGAKLALGVVVLRVDYRRIDLTGEPLLEIETRLAVGAGISF